VEVFEFKKSISLLTIVLYNQNFLNWLLWISIGKT